MDNNKDNLVSNSGVTTTTINNNNNKNNNKSGKSNKILISIKPKYAYMILSGEKRYEYRRVAPSKDISTLVVYISAPVKKISFEVEVIEVICLPIDSLHNLSKDKGGISKKEFYSYFKGKEVGYAYKLGKVKEYNPPLSIEEIGIKRAPESYRYIYKNRE